MIWNMILKNWGLRYKMTECEIKIIKGKALVRITKKLFEKRTYGLIQFLSAFCKDIKWSVEDSKF